MNEERYISWEQITSGCAAIVIDNIHALEKVEVVIGMSDDIIPATIISNLLKLPIVPVVNKTILNVDVKNIIDISKPLQSGHGKLPDCPKLLMVKTKIDDKMDVVEVIKEYKQRGHEVIVVTLFDCANYCSFVSDLYWQRNTDNIKLIFPWEL